MSKHILTPRLNQLAASIALVAGSIALVPAAYAAAPAAGSNISNIATASYVDNTGANQTSTSNEVKTVVLQIASFTLTADQSITANPNGQVSLPHTLTNTGNGTDTFKIDLVNVAGDDYDFTNIHVYLDSNKDGVPDNNVDINGLTISVGAGQNNSVGLVVVGTTLNTATNNQLGNLTVSATNVYTISAAGGSNTATTVSNTDTVKIVAGAVIEVTKAANVTNVNPAGTLAQRTVEYTLTYKNKGNAAATNVTLEDILPANVTYVPGSGVWSGAAGNRSDLSGDEAGAAYDFTSNTVNFVLGSVAANTTGTLKFKVVVNSTAPAAPINNTASFDPDGPGGDAKQPTNTAVVTVNSNYLGTINDSQADAYADADKDTGNTAKDDLITATTSQGVPVSFGNNGGETIWIHNTGNVSETYNLSVNKAGLPTGSVVELFKADGVTPLTDTNGDPLTDTGSIASNAAQKIVVKVTLPATYNGTTTPLPPLDTVITATPVNNGSAPDTLTLRITAVTANKVDLSNGAGDKNGMQDDTPNAGEGAYIATDIIDIKSTNPNTPVTFPLAITNFGTVSDNFNISSDLPAGWTVKYYTSNAAGVCSTNQITNTGNVGVNQTVYVCAVVTSPANATPTDSRDIVFNVLSSGTGLSDSIKDRININEIRNLSFTPDRTGQVAPSGTITYTHTLTNNGNVDEGVAGGNLLPYAVTHTGNLGATTSVYVDLNNNGLADNGELVTGSDLTALLAGTPGGAGLQPGEVVTILVKVEAPANATAGQADTSTVTITPTAGSAVKVEDTTTVNIGQVRLLKEQTVDANCDGTEDGGVGSYTQNSISAKPGQCVIYRITATNEGNAQVTNVVINDATPSFTKIPLTNPSDPLASNDGTTGTVTAPAAGATGNVSNPVGSLAPAASAKLKFGVQVDQ